MKNQIITLGSFDYARAQIIKSELSAANIECFQEHEEEIMSGTQSVVTLRINEADVENALKIINNYNDTLNVIKELLPRVHFPLKKIMVAVDFTEHTVVTCRYAMSIAKEFGAEIKFVHAYDNPAINSSPYIEPVVYAVEPLNELSILLVEAKKKLNTLKKEMKKIWPEARLSYTLINDGPVEGIIKATIDYKPGLIFIGHHMKDHLPHSIINHLARKVAIKTTIPVLIVPDNISVPDWNHTKKVLYATDLDDQDLVSLTILAEMMKPMNIEIHCVHVSLGAVNPIVQARFDLMKNEMSSRNIKLKNVVCKLIVGDDVENTLETYMRNNNIGMISITPHKRNLLTRWLTPSLTNQMVKYSEVPILLFHD